MTSDTRSPNEIEREIEAQRSELTSNLEDLQDRFSIDTMVRQIGDQFREHGGDISRSISDQVKANPIPLALTGIGIAWMMFGNGQKPVARPGYREIEDDYRVSRENMGRPYTPPTSRVSHQDSAPSWARSSYDDDYDQDDGPSVTDRLSDAGATAKKKAAGGLASTKQGFASATSAASDMASSTASSVSQKASAAASSISGAASSAQSSAQRGAEVARQRVANARHRIAEGTENLSEEARNRVIVARRKAIEMRENTAQKLSGGTDAAADFYDRQPLVVGALALAFGAALGGALPRTKTEDDLMGAQSDRLYDQAERIYEEEMAKAGNVVTAVKDEIESVAKDTKSDLDSGAPGNKSAVDAVGEKAKSAAKRVTTAAKTSAEKEKLGQPKV